MRRELDMDKGISQWPDILVFVLYFCVILAVGIWTIFKPQGGDVQTYFLAGRNMPWFAVGASMFAANIGPEVFIGLAGGGAVGGISLVLFEWFPIIIVLMLSWIFLPVFISAQVYTLPEYMEKRYGGKRLRIYLSCLSITVNTVSKLATCMFSGTLFLQLVLDWNMYISLAVLITVTMIFTVLGGLRAVIYVGTFQTMMMVTGAISVMAISFAKIGGYKHLEQKYFQAISSNHTNTSTCGLPREDAFHLFQDPLSVDQPWPALVLRASLGEVAIWCCNQAVVQRAISARSLSHAKAGTLLLGALKLLPLFLMVFPGMISRILFTDEVSFTDPDLCETFCANPAGCSNMAYPMLITELLPVGLRGLLLAIMVSAIMTSLTAVFSSECTVFTMDIWRTFRPYAKERELLIVGRLFTFVTCLIAIGFVPLVKVFQHGRLFNYMVAISGYLASPLGILFLLSMFWKRTTEMGAFCGLAVGHILGLSRLITELIYPEPPCGDMDDRPPFLRDIHSMYFIQIQLLCTLFVTVILSLLTTPRDDTEISGVTWWTKHDVTDDTELEIEMGGESSKSETDSNDVETTHTMSVDTKLEKDTGVTVKSVIDTTVGVPVKSVIDATVKDTSADKTPFSSSLLDRGVRNETSDSKIRCSPPFTKKRTGTNNEDICTLTQDREAQKAYLTQDKNASTLLNLLAIFLILIVAFLTGYFK